jgi:excisionase family DNA binding protein
VSTQVDALLALLTLPERLAALEASQARIETALAEIRRAQVPELLTVQDAAKRLHVPQSTVRRWIRDGTLPVQRVGPSGRGVRIDLAALRAPTDAEVRRLAFDAQQPTPTKQPRPERSGGPKS